MMNGKKDMYGKLIPDMSLQIMKMQVDFANEETLLEPFVHTLGARASKSPHHGCSKKVVVIGK
jgi:hypothetical protein